jgi:hypothetical protein
MDGNGDLPPRPAIELARGPDGTWRGPPGSAALLGDRGDVAARTPADLAGLVFGCWCLGIDVTFLGNGFGGGGLVARPPLTTHAGGGPRRPDQSEVCDSEFDDEAAAQLCRAIAKEHRRGA